MEYCKKYPLEYNPSIREIQRELNLARIKAYQLVDADMEYRNLMMSDCHYFEKLHHLEYVPSAWNNIVEDGLYGEDTENAVKSFQQFCYISVNGIVGDYTRSFLKNIISLHIPNKSQIKATTPETRSHSSNNSKLSGVSEILTSFFNNVILESWNNIAIPVNGFCFFLGNGFIVLSEKIDARTTLHVDLNRIAKSLLLPERSRPGKWIHINDKSKFRQFRAFNVSKSMASINTPLSNIGFKIGVVGLIIEYIDAIGKGCCYKLKFTDIAKVGFDTVSTSFDFLLRNAPGTARLPIQQSSVKLGQELLKYKFAVRIFGTAAAAGIAVVFVQCVGAVMLGVDLGNWFERRTHVGERAVNFCWELFLGDLVEKACEWKADRVVCVKYPDDWSESQIQEFQNKF